MLIGFCYRINLISVDCAVNHFQLRETYGLICMYIPVPGPSNVTFAVGDSPNIRTLRTICSSIPVSDYFFNRKNTAPFVFILNVIFGFNKFLNIYTENNKFLNLIRK